MSVIGIAYNVSTKDSGKSVNLVAKCSPDEQKQGDWRYVHVPSFHVFSEDGKTPFSLNDGEVLFISHLKGHVNFRSLGGEIHFNIRPESGGAPLCPAMKVLERNKDYGTYPDTSPVSGAYLEENCTDVDHPFDKPHTTLIFGEHGGTPILCSDSNIFINGNLLQGNVNQVAQNSSVVSRSVDSLLRLLRRLLA